MIQPNKQAPAHEALHFILIKARSLAYEAGNKELGDLLDAAEILPRYFVETEDFTETYRLAVHDIADRYACGHAAVLFDEVPFRNTVPVP